MSSSGIEQLVGELTGGSAPHRIADLHLREATVISIDTVSTCTIGIGGVYLSSGVRWLSPYYPVVNDNVIYLEQGDVRIVIGASSTGPNPQAWHQPWGALGPPVSITSAVTGITAEVTVSGVSFGPYTIPANRIIRVHVHNGAIVQQTAGGLVKLALMDGSTKLGLIFNRNLTAGERATADGAIEYLPAAGAHTWTLHATTSAGTLDVNASNTGDPGPTVIYVEDVGPNGNP